MLVRLGQQACQAPQVRKALLDLPATLDLLGPAVREAHLDQVDHKEVLDSKDQPVILAAPDRRVMPVTSVNKV